MLSIVFTLWQFVMRHFVFGYRNMEYIEEDFPTISQAAVTTVILVDTGRILMKIYEPDWLSRLCQFTDRTRLGKGK